MKRNAAMRIRTEIPCISEHPDNARDNAPSQIRELHASGRGAKERGYAHRACHCHEPEAETDQGMNNSFTV